METLPIVEPFDVGKDFASRLIAGEVPFVGEQFIRQGDEEA